MHPTAGDGMAPTARGSHYLDMEQRLDLDVLAAA